MTRRRRAAAPRRRGTSRRAAPPICDARLVDLDGQRERVPDRAIPRRAADATSDYTSSILDEGTRSRAEVLVTVGDRPGSLEQLMVDCLTPGGLDYDASTSFVAAAPGTTFAYLANFAR